MDFELIAKAFSAVQKGQSYAFATVVEATVKGTPRKAGAKMVVLEDGQLFGSIGGGRNEKAAREECLRAIKNGKPALVTYDYFGQEGQSVCGGQIKVFIEPFLNLRHFVLCGGGHIGLPLSFLAKILGFKLTVIDNRREFASASRFPHANAILCGAYAQMLRKIPVDEKTYVMVVTQGNEHDYECLRALINLNIGYLGVISSKAKRIKFFNRLKKEGFKEALFKKVSIPAGLDLGAQTPEEIAVSIAAEIIKENNAVGLGTDKFKEKVKAKVKAVKAKRKRSKR